MKKELTEEEKNHVSHRSVALKHVLEFLLAKKVS
jgi:inosine/xanthosine triphosphate pyrophosphatase family protein